MVKGTVVSIHISTTAAGAMQAVGQVRAIPGQGLQKDRYGEGTGTFAKHSPTNELTLIEAEASEALTRDYGIELLAGESRRNITTRGVALNHLVGREFRIGEIRVRGLQLCEPCSHLERLTGKKLIKALTHRGGLRAQILTVGDVRVGDEITAE